MFDDVPARYFIGNEIWLKHDLISELVEHVWWWFDHVSFGNKTCSFAWSRISLPDDINKHDQTCLTMISWLSFRLALDHVTKFEILKFGLTNR